MGVVLILFLLTCVVSGVVGLLCVIVSVPVQVCVVWGVLFRLVQVVFSLLYVLVLVLSVSV